MSAKLAKNGVISMAHGDTVTAGGTDYRIETVIFNFTSDTTITVYSGVTATSGNEIAQAIGVGGQSVPIQVFGCITTGNGLCMSVADAGSSTAILMVR